MFNKSALTHEANPLVNFPRLISADAGLWACERGYNPRSGDFKPRAVAPASAALAQVVQTDTAYGAEASTRQMSPRRAWRADGWCGRGETCGKHGREGSPRGQLHQRERAARPLADPAPLTPAPRVLSPSRDGCHG
jgi:hypothetical protein